MGAHFKSNFIEMQQLKMFLFNVEAVEANFGCKKQPHRPTTVDTYTYIY